MGETGGPSINRSDADGDHSAREMQTQFRTSGGNILDCLITAELVELEGRSCVLSLVQDITDRVRAEERIKASEEHFRSLIENGKDVILVLDPTDRYATRASRWKPPWVTHRTPF